MWGPITHNGGMAMQLAAALAKLKQFIQEAPDFPKAGIVFRDFSPLLRHWLLAVLEVLTAQLSNRE
jgi:adenine/guanine phosphoribosyltransferase-like PRPP-binding protein